MHKCSSHLPDGRQFRRENGSLNQKLPNKTNCQMYKDWAASFKKSKISASKSRVPTEISEKKSRE